MKKLLGILVLGLLWCNLSFASIDDLDIPIMKAEAETEIIKPNKEYRQSCETDVIIEGFGLNLKFNSYVDVSGKKQTLIGTVVSAKMEKTVSVRVTREIPHPIYRKRIKKYKNYLAHLGAVTAVEGDIVKITSIRPISKMKRWLVSKVLKESVNIG